MVDMLLYLACSHLKYTLDLYVSVHSLGRDRVRKKKQIKKFLKITWKIVKIAECHWVRWVLHAFSLETIEGCCAVAEKNLQLVDDGPRSRAKKKLKPLLQQHHLIANNEFAPSTPIAVKMFMSWHVLSATLIKRSFHSSLFFFLSLSICVAKDFLTNSSNAEEKINYSEGERRKKHTNWMYTPFFE